MQKKYLVIVPHQLIHENCHVNTYSKAFYKNKTPFFKTRTLFLPPNNNWLLGTSIGSVSGSPLPHKNENLSAQVTIVLPQVLNEI